MRGRGIKKPMVVQTPSEFVQLMLEDKRTVDLRNNTQDVRDIKAEKVVCFRSLSAGSVVARILRRRNFPTLFDALQDPDTILGQIIPEMTLEMIWSKHREHNDARTESISGVVRFELEILEKYPAEDDNDAGA